MENWCKDSHNTPCPSLGTNSTDIFTNDPTICANTTFWRQQPCGKTTPAPGEDLIRCRGSNSGQCVKTSDWGHEYAKDDWGNNVSCQDGSDKYRLINQIVMNEKNPNHQIASNQSWELEVESEVYKNESNPFKVPPQLSPIPDAPVEEESLNKMVSCGDHQAQSCAGCPQVISNSILMICSYSVFYCK